MVASGAAPDGRIFGNDDSEREGDGDLATISELRQNHGRLCTVVLIKLYLTRDEFQGLPPRGGASILFPLTSSTRFVYSQWYL